MGLFSNGNVVQGSAKNRSTGISNAINLSVIRAHQHSWQHAQIKQFALKRSMRTMPFYYIMRKLFEWNALKISRSNTKYIELKFNVLESREVELVAIASNLVPLSIDFITYELRATIEKGRGFKPNWWDKGRTMINLLYWSMYTVIPRLLYHNHGYLV